MKKFKILVIQKLKNRHFSSTKAPNNIDINEVVVSNKISFGKNGFKYFIGFKDFQRLKAKVKSYEEKINTNFRSDKIPKEGSHSICLSLVLIDSVYRTDNNYYLQGVFRRV